MNPVDSNVLTGAIAKLEIALKESRDKADEFRKRAEEWDKRSEVYEELLRSWSAEASISPREVEGPQSLHRPEPRQQMGVSGKSLRTLIKEVLMRSPDGLSTNSIAEEIRRGGREATRAKVATAISGHQDYVKIGIGDNQFIWKLSATGQVSANGGRGGQVSDEDFPAPDNGHLFDPQ